MVKARAVFKKAREDQRSRYHVYVAGALIEYYCTKVHFSFFLNILEASFSFFCFPFSLDSYLIELKSILISLTNCSN